VVFENLQVLYIQIFIHYLVFFTAGDLFLDFLVDASQHLPC